MTRQPVWRKCIHPTMGETHVCVGELGWCTFGGLVS